MVQVANKLFHYGKFGRTVTTAHYREKTLKVIEIRRVKIYGLWLFKNQGSLSTQKRTYLKAVVQHRIDCDSTVQNGEYKLVEPLENLNISQILPVNHLWWLDRINHVNQISWVFWWHTRLHSSAEYKASQWHNKIVLWLLWVDEFLLILPFIGQESGSIVPRCSARPDPIQDCVSSSFIQPVT